MKTKQEWFFIRPVHLNVLWPTEAPSSDEGVDPSYGTDASSLDCVNAPKTL